MGSIGVGNGSSYAYIGTGDTGLMFNSGSDFIQPWNPSTNGSKDNGIDLGSSSHRFKNLELSGSTRSRGTYHVFTGADVLGSTGGITSTGSNPIVIGTDGTERMRIDSSGNLLVGTTTSRGKLTVKTANVTGSDSDFDVVGLAPEMTITTCLLYTSPSPRDRTRSRMPSSA